MKTIFTLILLTVFLSVSFAQEYRAEFVKYLNDGDTLAQLEVLKNWEKENPNNPELFTSYFNYYFFKSRTEILSLQSGQTNEEALIIQDSSGKDVGFIGSQMYYNIQILQKGFDKINRGIELYPNRLDMRFGKIYVMGQTEDWEAFTNEIIKTVEYSRKNNNAWTWTFNKEREDGKYFFLSSLQDYQVQLYETGEDSLLINMQNIANAILKLYPDNIESLSNLSVTYVILNEYDKALEALKKAEKLDPRDPVILNNMANCYKLKGDKENAMLYYQRTIENGSESAATYARQQIEELGAE